MRAVCDETPRCDPAALWRTVSCRTRPTGGWPTSSITSKLQGSRSRPQLSRTRWARPPPVPNCWQRARTSIKHIFSLCLTGNRWQVPAPDDAQRCLDRAVDKTGPCAEDLRVSREAAADSAPEEQRVVAQPASSGSHLQWQSLCWRLQGRVSFKKKKKNERKSLLILKRGKEIKHPSSFYVFELSRSVTEDDSTFFSSFQE